LDQYARGEWSNAQHSGFAVSLDIEPHRVDVNVHPTKSEVGHTDMEPRQAWADVSVHEGSIFG
jgi:DNA mismatch repair ATPase MutL